MESTLHITLNRLVHPARGRDWTEYYRSYSGIIFRYTRNLGLNQERAGMVVQEVMVDLIRLFPRSEPSPGTESFRSELLILVHWRSLRISRRVTPRPLELLNRLDALNQRCPRPQDALRWRRSIIDQCLKQLAEAQDQPSSGNEIKEWI